MGRIFNSIFWIDLGKSLPSMENSMVFLSDLSVLCGGDRINTVTTNENKTYLSYHD
jgi:hypothetical protein